MAEPLIQIIAGIAQQTISAAFAHHELTPAVRDDQKAMEAHTPVLEHELFLRVRQIDLHKQTSATLVQVADDIRGMVQILGGYINTANVAIDVSACLNKQFVQMARGAASAAASVNALARALVNLRRVRSKQGTDDMATAHSGMVTGSGFGERPVLLKSNEVVAPLSALPRLIPKIIVPVAVPMPMPRMSGVRPQAQHPRRRRWHGRFAAG